ncbi:Uma2 family endonuclease [Methylobacterium marchantiae]|uniref:Uma2 family endonuclease n=1 Tax=Methylobacterium marchantiae TaxID=600331 RepID=A0ABW3WTU8_9HYPH|nr:hypothetical protein AIGOOFII_0616 [Methylobacterium marchantiae]
MAVAARRDPHMTVAAYRPRGECRPDEHRGELLDGAPVAVLPPRTRYQTIDAWVIKRPGDPADHNGRRALPDSGRFGLAIDDVGPIPGEVARSVPPLSADDPADSIRVAEASSDRTVKPDCDRRTSLIVPQDEAGIEVPDGDDGHDLHARGGTIAARDVYTGIFR